MNWTRWSNASGLETHREIISNVIAELEAMKLEINEDAPGQVKKLMDPIPKRTPEAESEKGTYNIEKRKTEFRMAMKG